MTDSAAGRRGSAGSFPALPLSPPIRGRRWLTGVRAAQWSRAEGRARPPGRRGGRREPAAILDAAETESAVREGGRGPPPERSATLIAIIRLTGSGEGTSPRALNPPESLR